MHFPFSGVVFSLDFDPFFFLFSSLAERFSFFMYSFIYLFKQWVGRAWYSIRISIKGNAQKRKPNEWIRDDVQ